MEADTDTEEVVEMDRDFVAVRDTLGVADGGMKLVVGEGEGVGEDVGLLEGEGSNTPVTRFETGTPNAVAVPPVASCPLSLPPQHFKLPLVRMTHVFS